MRRTGGFVAALGLIGSLTGAAPGALAQDVCARLVPALPGAACLATAHGAVLAPDAARAAVLAGYASAGERRFETGFGRPATPYVVFEAADPAQGRTVTAALRALGFNRTLSWSSRAAQKADRIKALQEGVVPQMRAGGRSEDSIAAFVRRRMDGLDAEIEAREASVVPHELSHQWYVQAGWPTAIGDAGGHYGGPGPDWMDELAAILAESDAAADGRRAQFEDLYRNTRPELSANLTRAALLDLSPFFDQIHPIHARNAATGAARPPSGATVSVTAGAAGLTDPASLFYLRARMVADFLVARTGDLAIFGAILDAFARGETIDQWLATAGHGLAPDRAGLDRQWRDWLRARFGEPGLA